MTIDHIRNCIKVNYYQCHAIGVLIQYWWSTKTSEAWEEKELSLNPEDFLIELKSMGEIEDWLRDESSRLVIKIGVEWIHWGAFIDKYIFSQYDAIQLVIRYEYAKSLESDTNMLEIDKALEALKNI